jgi:hypothetical protein
MRRLVMIAAAAAVTGALTPSPAASQVYAPAPGMPYPPPLMRPLPRVVIHPRVREQWYRDCVGGFGVEPRLTGPTVVPIQRCRWAKRYYSY